MLLKQYKQILYADNFLPLSFNGELEKKQHYPSEEMAVPL